MEQTRQIVRNSGATPVTLSQRPTNMRNAFSDALGKLDYRSQNKGLGKRITEKMKRSVGWVTYAAKRVEETGCQETQTPSV